MKQTFSENRNTTQNEVKGSTMKNSGCKSVILTLALAAGISCGAADAGKKAVPAKAAPVKAAPVKAAPVKKAPVKTLSQLMEFLPNVVAEVGTRKITKKDIMAQMNGRRIPQEMLSQIPEGQFRMYLRQMIGQMVDQYVLLALAEKSGIKPNANLVRAQLDKLYGTLPKQQKDMFENQMKAQGKSFASYKEEMAKNEEAQKSCAISQYLEKNVMEPNKNKVTDAEVEKFYRENQKQFEKPETVTVAHILAMAMDRGQDGKQLSKEDLAKKDAQAKKKIEDVYAKLKQGAKFEELAEKFSECPSGKAAKGVLPSFDKNGRTADGVSMDKEFTDAAFTLAKPGQTTGIVKTHFGYHIIRLNDKKAAEFIPLAQVKNDIKAYLTQQLNFKAIQELLQKNKKAMNVKINGFPADPAPAKAIPAAVKK